ncbi:LysR substrate-binding domain-containing protein [Acidovorax sp. Leaf160]|uniref:LysR substrate-binding domain-containing protein n=1 Tax=Acidovorax sp. Leaf160 TaxID=1736280 RepID=UPI0006F90D54|nr:LysR substrate-binding domain-containing protein [Acidovorax sp. Leaf160]KQR57888.1 LysR family transcriptional regulator [Acidovorax sp. Leaf160]
MNLLAAMRYLVALDEHRHFGRAAQACHITQPALSNALRALEQEFGVVIVQRGRAFAGLTHEGDAVVAAARRMLHDTEVLRRELRSTEASPQGRLRMAATPTAIPLLTRFAVQLRTRHPGIQPVVLSMSSVELERGLEDLSVDLALGYSERMQARQAQLRSWPQCSERYYLVRRAAQPSQERMRIGEAIPWAEAGRLPLCLLTPDMFNRSIVDDALRAAGVQPVPAIETNSVLTLVLSVQSGDVCSVLPGALVAASRHERSLEALPLVSPDIRTPIGFMTQRGPRWSRALEGAVALLEQPAWRDEVAASSGMLEA